MERQRFEKKECPSALERNSIHDRRTSSIEPSFQQYPALAIALRIQIVRGTDLH